MSKWIAKRMAKPFVPMFKLCFAMQGDFCKAFYEKYGEEALPIIAEVLGKAGVEHGKLSEIRGTLKAVGERLQFAGDVGLTPKVEIIASSDEMLHIKHPPPCTRGLEGTSRELCETLHNSYDKKMLSTTLGQEVEMKVLKTLAAGDEHCEVIFSIKK